MNGSIQRISTALFTLLVLGFVSAAQAACTISQLNGFNFGSSVTSFAAQSSALQASSFADIQCNKMLELNALGSSNLEVEPLTSTGGFRLLGPDNNSIAYRLGFNPSLTPSIGSVGESLDLSNSNLTSIVLGGRLRIPLFAQTLPANLSEGTYSDTLSLLFTGRFCSISITGACLFPEYLNDTASLTLTLIVTKACSIDVPESVSFGRLRRVSESAPITLPIAVKCTLQQDYTVSINNGQHFNTHRRLSNGQTDFIPYQIWQPDAVTPLDSANVMSAAGSGVFQTYNTRLTLIDDGLPKHVGSYSDQVVITVTF